MGERLPVTVLSGFPGEGANAAIPDPILQSDLALALWRRANPCPDVAEPAAQIDGEVPAGTSVAVIAGTGTCTCTERVMLAIDPVDPVNALS